MRAIRELNAFKRDVKRLRASPRYRDVGGLLADVLRLLSADVPLPAQFKDHPLSGEWRGARDCHVKFDLVLIYRKQGHAILELMRLGSHSELFGR